MCRSSSGKETSSFSLDSFPATWGALLLLDGNIGASCPRGVTAELTGIQHTCNGESLGSVLTTIHWRSVGALGRLNLATVKNDLPPCVTR